MGFVKLPDDLTRWAWFDDNNTLCVYVRLLLAAAWEPREYKNVRLERGQLMTSLAEVATNNNITIQQTRNILKRLETTNRITIEATRKYSIITLIDYDLNFQSNIQNNKQKTNKQLENQQSNNTPNNKATLLNTEYRDQNTEYIPARDDKKISDKSNSSSPKILEKKKFAEFVSLTNEEYSSLTEKLGEQGVKRCIEILDNYKGANGKSYKSDYRAILSWVIERYRQENPQVRGEPEQSGSSFDMNAVMSQIIGKYKSG